MNFFKAILEMELKEGGLTAEKYFQNNLNALKLYKQENLKNYANSVHMSLIKNLEGHVNQQLINQ